MILPHTLLYGKLHVEKVFPTQPPVVLDGRAQDLAGLEISLQLKGHSSEWSVISRKATLLQIPDPHSAGKQPLPPSSKLTPSPL